VVLPGGIAGPWEQIARCEHMTREDRLLNVLKVVGGFIAAGVALVLIGLMWEGLKSMPSV
jgi:hypothetical protein